MSPSGSEAFTWAVNSSAGLKVETLHLNDFNPKKENRKSLLVNADV